MLLEVSRVKINQSNNSGETPLDVACQKEHEKIAKMLIEKGASPGSMQKNTKAFKFYEEIIKKYPEIRADKVHSVASHSSPF